MRGRHVLLSLALFISLVQLANCLPTKYNSLHFLVLYTRMKMFNVETPYCTIIDKRKRQVPLL